VQNRWDSHGLTDLGQTRTAVNSSRFWCQETCLSTGDGIASGSKYNNIMLDQFFYDGDVPRIQRGPGVVSPNHAGHTSYAAVDDVVV
jgi:hypothetical protein